MAVLSYHEFNSGITFQEAVEEIRAEARQKLMETGQYMFWTRRTILGRMHQRKREAYDLYLRYERKYGQDRETPRQPE